jgi:quinol monooxygenase YgiN
MERYKDEDAVKAHRGSDHFRSLGKEMGAFMDGPPEILRLNELA